jgi:hypothetical protein
MCCATTAVQSVQSYRDRQDAASRLRRRACGGNVLTMYALARFLQLVGLTIPPLAIVAQLAESISLGQMLGFLIVGVVAFSIGYLLQTNAGGRPR